MEHEVFVPFPVEIVRSALTDPVRLAESVPGLLPDAEGPTGVLTGRLRLRIAGSTITYRGTLTVTEQDGGDLTVEGEGDEARGTGSAKLALNLRLTPGDGGTVIGCTGAVRSEGRLAAVAADTAAAAGRRLLDRCAAELTAGLEAGPVGPPPLFGPAPGEPAAEDGFDLGEGFPQGPESGGIGTSPDDNERAIPGIPAPEKGDDTPEEPGPSGDGDAQGIPGWPPAGEFGTEPPASPEPAGPGEAAGPGEVGDGLPDGAGQLPQDPPAEAAHARRTMIGRSTEEVDHAPPRGRYAPVPGPQPPSTAATLRWAAPTAAAVLVSAVVLGRVLRRRH
ncbi:SRPBCC family protein [Streptomyces sp. TP-A0874]|uniref:SRPBCC family protein n=1 Tax=Streptomyces sp. TP-A0874 TaxID=549819 RepID=UPI000852EA2D|nr:SRPBCC family protein [Streptomyces sp. TP-A0874]